MDTSSRPVDALAERRHADVAEGQKLLVRFECARCHDGTGVPEVALERHCARCHEQIVLGTFDAPTAALRHWKPNVAPLTKVPSLSGVGRLLEPAWVEQFIQRPHDVRPNLAPMMPRLGLSAEETRVIVAALVAQSEGTAPSEGKESPEATDPTSEGSIDRGSALFREKGCGGCHGLVESPPTAPTEAARLAPHLRFARVRLRRDAMVRFLIDPPSVKPDTLMPKQGLTRQQALDLAAYILRTPLNPTPAPPFERLPILAREVRFDEVRDRVFKRTCWHCHSEPSYARGDGGPGNTGGFGFPARGIDLSSYESIMSGGLGPTGERESLFLSVGETPRLLAALLARHSESEGTIGPVRGMPLGLPALSAEEIQLVETWIEQGHLR